MRIGIDAHTICLETTGGRTYVKNMLEALSHIDTENQYTLYFVLRKSLGHPLLKRKNFRAELLVPNRWIRQGVHFPIRLLRRPLDVLHAQNIAPLFHRGKLVLTVFDIAWAIHPHFYPPLTLLGWRAMIPWSIRRAETVITSSWYSRRQLIEYLRVPPEKIRVLYFAPDPAFHPIRDPDRLAFYRRKYHLPERFLLYVGALTKRKNLSRLFRAFQKAKLAGKVKLVLVGRKMWSGSNLEEVCTRLGLEHDILFTDYVPDEDLPYLYNLADAMVFPSLFEGFGFPPLEAMACEIPVALSTASCLPEIAGEAARYFDPVSEEEMADAISSVLEDRTLRAELIRKGVQRTNAFSWRGHAEETLEIYREAGAGG